jgi:hypothetical protein
MKSPGRPSGYQPEYARLARNYCELGARNDQLAKYFGVSPRTIDNWIVNFAEFGEAVREARVLGDEALWRSCYQRAKGYYYTEKRVVRDGGKERVEITTKHCKADLRAFMIWFHNRTQWLAKTGGAANEEALPTPTFDTFGVDDEVPVDNGMPDGANLDAVLHEEVVSSEPDGTSFRQEDASEEQGESRPLEEDADGRLPIHNDLTGPDGGGPSVVHSRPEHAGSQVHPP